MRTAAGSLLSAEVLEGLWRERTDERKEEEDRENADEWPGGELMPQTSGAL